MTTRGITKAIAVATVLLYAACLATDAQSRGPGGGGGRAGGGGFSRAGPAAGGSFSAGRTLPQPGGQMAAGRPGARAGQGGAHDYAAQRQPMASERQAQRQQAHAQSGQNMTERQQSRQENASEAQRKRQEYGQELQEERQKYAKEAREDWQDYNDNDDWDNWGAVAAGTAVAVGAYAVGRASATPTTTYVVDAPCDPLTPVHVNGVSYYRCGSSWYTRSYVGGDIVYSLSAPPPGF